MNVLPLFAQLGFFFGGPCPRLHMQSVRAAHSLQPDCKLRQIACEPKAELYCFYIDERSVEYCALKIHCFGALLAIAIQCEAEKIL